MPRVAFSDGDEAVQRALADGFGREQAAQVVPLVGEFVVSVVGHAPDPRALVARRFAAAVVEGELGEVGQHAHRQFGRPGVAAYLEGGFVGLAARVERHAGAFGFHEEDGPATHAEGVVGRFHPPAHRHPRFVDDLLVLLGVALRVVHVPAQRLEEGIDELAASLGLVVGGTVVLRGFTAVFRGLTAVFRGVVVETPDQVKDGLGDGHDIPFCDSSTFSNRSHNRRSTRSSTSAPVATPPRNARRQWGLRSTPMSSAG